MIDKKLITITRGDMPPGYQLAQSVHSSLEIAYLNDSIEFKNWKNLSNTVICLSAKDEKELFDIKKKISEYTTVYPFYEPDIGNQLTAISYIADDTIRELTSHLPLALGY